MDSRLRGNDSGIAGGDGNIASAIPMFIGTGPTFTPPLPAVEKTPPISLCSLEGATRTQLKQQKYFHSRWIEENIAWAGGGW